MARTKVNRSLSLKAFVEALMAANPKAKTFTRQEVEAIGKINPIGQTEFASVGHGYGASTRIGRGQYAIPAAWLTDAAPWTGVEADAPVASVRPKTPKEPKQKVEKPMKEKKSKIKTDVSAETAMAPEPVMKKKSDPKKTVTKKELFEKAKAEIAKRKSMKNTAATEASAGN